MDYFTRRERSIKMIKPLLKKGTTMAEMNRVLLENDGAGDRWLKHYIQTYNDLLDQDLLMEGTYKLWETKEN